MSFLGAHTALGDEVWTARRYMYAEPHEVLCALTEPDEIAQWAPVSFEVDGLRDDRLRSGSQARVSGSLAGIGTAFDVEILKADADGVELVARGPLTLDVTYRFRQSEDRLIVDVTVSVGPARGFRHQLLRAALVGLLGAGALASALRRLETSVVSPAEAELVAA